MSDEIDELLDRYRAELDALPGLPVPPDQGDPEPVTPTRLRVAAEFAWYDAIGPVIGGALRLWWGWNSWRRCDYLYPLYDAAVARGRTKDALGIAERGDGQVATRSNITGGCALLFVALCVWGYFVLPGWAWAVAGALWVGCLWALGRTFPDPVEDADPVVEVDADEGEGVDTLSGPPPRWPLDGVPTADIRADGVPLGYDEVREVFALPLDRHVLAAGATGSGKSQMLRTIIAAAVKDPRAEVHAWSAKSGRDFADLVPGCATGGGGPASLARLSRVLHDLVESLPQREADGARLCVVVVDEVHHALAHDVHGKAITASVTALVELGRSAGVVVVLGVQRPTKASVPPRIAEQCEVRIGMRVRTPAESRILFGEDADDDGLRPDRFDPAVPGLAWVAGHAGPPVRVRGWIVPAVPLPAGYSAPGTEAVRTGTGTRVQDVPVCDGPECENAVRTGTRYCSARCKQRAYRARHDL